MSAAAGGDRVTDPAGGHVPLLDRKGEGFHRVGIDPGLCWEAHPGWMLRRIKGATVRQYACSEYPQIQRRLQRGLAPSWNDSAGVAVFEANSVRVRARDVTLHNGSLQIARRWLLNGASGERLLTRFLKLETEHPDQIGRMHRYFDAARGTARLDLPEIGTAPADVPAVIECRNRHNYYHFTTETLPALVHFLNDTPDRIMIHCRNSTPSAFSRRFIDVLFPQIADRIEFDDGGLHLEDAVIALNARHLIHSNGDPLLTGPLQAAATLQADWAGMQPDAQSRKFAREHTTDRSLRLLRDRAVALLDPDMIAQQPRRIMVARDAEGSNTRDRRMRDPSDLAGHLQQRGFHIVHFEHLSPLEQIAQMHAADIIVADHGAFFANMTYARPETHVIEIGTLQTQRHRWGDFLTNAHASGCRYTTVFADVASDTPHTVAPVGDGLLGVRVGPSARDRILRLVDEAAAG